MISFGPNLQSKVDYVEFVSDVKSSTKYIIKNE